MTDTATTTPTNATDLAVIKLTKSLARTSLTDLVKSKRRSLLLVDVSGSMAEGIRTGGRKIDALRTVVTTLRETHPVPVAAFGIGGRYGAAVALVDSIPDPSGSTPLAEAIDFGAAEGATHLVVVTDGIPNSESAAFASAEVFGGPVDVFYIGDGNDSGARFSERLAMLTGGSVNLTDLGTPKALAGSIRLLLGDGTAA